MYYTYVLQSEIDNKFNVGFTKDLKLRFEHHQKGYVDSTKNRRPLKLIYYEAWSTDFRRKRKYRVVIPVVFYHGKSAWNLPIHFIDNFDVNENLKTFMLDFSYLLFDTNKWHPGLENPKTDNIYLLCSMMLMKMAYHNDWDGVVSILGLLKEKG
jgi:putative endonuclease